MVKNTRKQNQDSDDTNNDNEQSGFLDSIAGALSGIGGMADGTRDAQNAASNRGMTGSIEDMIRGVTELNEGAQREARRGTVGGSLEDIVRGATEMSDAAERQERGKTMGGSLENIISGATEMSEAATESGGGYGSSGGGYDSSGGWEYPQEGVTTDAGGNIVGSGIFGGGSNDSGMDATYQEDEVWVSHSDSEGGVGSGDYLERLRRGHEAYGDEYQSDLGQDGLRQSILGNSDDDQNG